MRALLDACMAGSCLTAADMAGACAGLFTLDGKPVRPMLRPKEGLSRPGTAPLQAGGTIKAARAGLAAHRSVGTPLYHAKSKIAHIWKKKERPRAMSATTTPAGEQGCHRACFQACASQEKTAT
jgi:hypothetical protein